MRTASSRRTHDHAHAGTIAGGRGRWPTCWRSSSGSGLTPRQRERAAAVYRRLAEAEAKTHGTTRRRDPFPRGRAARRDPRRRRNVRRARPARDRRAALLAVPDRSRQRSAWSTALYPNPPPATARTAARLADARVDVAGELVTPTAAAILTTLATPGRPDLVLERIGYGAGRSDFAIPNVTRVMIGTALAADAPAGRPGPSATTSS